MRRASVQTAVCALALILVACGGSGGPEDAAPPPAVQHHTIDIAGMKRPYRLYVPLSLDRAQPAPLVIVMGGVGNSAESMVGATEFDRTAETGGFIVAYPEGVNETWNAGYCCLGRAATGPDDVAFLGRLIDDVSGQNKVDASRVYATGVSVGGMMAYRLACDLSDRIAGVGSVAGAMILDDCHPSRPVAVIEIHGTADTLVPYEGGRTAGGATQPSPPTPAVAEKWAELNRCPNAPRSQTDGPVTTKAWTACASGTAVELVTIEGGGHTWFAPGLGPVSGAVDATSLLWDFLKDMRQAR